MSDLGRGEFYDGTSARRHDVTLSAEVDGLVLMEDCAALSKDGPVLAGDRVAIAGDRIALARWPFAEIRRRDAPDGLYRFACVSASDLARLEIRDPALAAELACRCPRLEDGRPGLRTVRGILLWSFVAAASLVLTAAYLVPVVADRVAPLVPVSVEQRLGRAVDSQVRAVFGSADCANPRGREALAARSARLMRAAELPVPVEVAVLPSEVPNAFALPGGHVYLLDGLLQRAESVDEVAGVLAHELGHVAHRDGLRLVLQAGGTSFLLGLLFGDVTGSTTVIWVGQMMLNNAHSRQAETAADAFAADMMLELGRSPRSLGAFLLRITGDEKDDPLPFLHNHPLSGDRGRALAARDAPVRSEPLLSQAQWQALKEICR